MSSQSSAAETLGQPEPSPQRRTGPYTLGVPAEEMYEHLRGPRESVIRKGRALAEITIPSVLPPDGYRVGDNIAEKNQSIGAGCVNTLASKLQFMAFPPDRPVLRYEPVEHKLRADIDQNPGLWTQIQIALSRLEMEHKSRLEATNIRSAYLGFVKSLIVAGNSLWVHLKLDSPTHHNMTHYVVKRNSQGEQLFVVLEMHKDWLDLDEDIQAIILNRSPELSKITEYKREAVIHAVCKLAKDGDDKPYWEYWEEYKGEMLEGTQFESDFEMCPMYAAWMVPVYGDNWGRSYCEEYEGDLLLVEGHSASLNDGSSIAALMWLFLKPGARTNPRQLKTAGNMSLLTGDSSDITIGPDLATKARDFTFVSNNLEAAVRRLSRAFLSISSVQRDAERVTAEEFSRMAAELDQATGGLYSEIAQSTQRHVVRRAVGLHYEEDKDLPELPPGVFRVAVVTGLEAMGRTIGGQNFEEATNWHIEATKGASLQYIDIHDLVRRSYMYRGVPMDGLVRTPEQQAVYEQEQKRQQMQKMLVEQGTGPAINAIGKGAMPSIEGAVANQQQQQAPTNPGDGEAPPAPPGGE